MPWNKTNSILGTFLLGAVCVLFSASLVYSESVYLIDQDIFETQAYRTFQENPDADLPEARYLIDLLRESPYQFERKEKTYNGQKAGEHILLKLSLFREEVKTTEEFIERIASYSRRSGQPYYFIGKNGQRVPLKPVLYAELERLRVKLAVK